jgi:hypothetical protein
MTLKLHEDQPKPQSAIKKYKTDPYFRYKVIFTLKLCIILIVACILIGYFFVGYYNPVSPVLEGTNSAINSLQSASSPTGTNQPSSGPSQSSPNLISLILQKITGGTLYGFSTSLSPSDNQTEQFNSDWSHGLESFKLGHSSENNAYLNFVELQSLSSEADKNAVCDAFHQSAVSLQNSEGYFQSAKANCSFTSDSTYTVDMAINYIDQINATMLDEEMICRDGVRASGQSDDQALQNDISNMTIDNHINKIKYNELNALNSSFAE